MTLHEFVGFIIVEILMVLVICIPISAFLGLFDFINKEEDEVKKYD